MVTPRDSLCWAGGPVRLGAARSRRSRVVPARGGRLARRGGGGRGDQADHRRAVHHHLPIRTQLRADWNLFAKTNRPLIQCSISLATEAGGAPVAHVAPQGGNSFASGPGTV